MWLEGNQAATQTTLALGSLLSLGADSRNRVSVELVLCSTRIP